MCIIAAKAAGIPMPSASTLRNMWNANRDGAGLMYVEKGAVRIEKGFMTWDAFENAIERISSRLDLTATPVVMHFRITTHGGTKPENCHPFPISDNIGVLRKLVCKADVGVAHNGVITINNRKGISDTMEYIASQLAPLKRVVPRFYENRDAMLMIENAIESKMAFLTSEGKIYTVGRFVTDNGVLYSNSSYEGYTYNWRNLDNYSCYEYPYDQDIGDDIPGNKPWEDDDAVVMNLMWFPTDAYYMDRDGNLIQDYDNLLDCEGHVYWYDYEGDVCYLIEGARACNGQGLQLLWNDKEAEPMLVDLGSTF